MHPTSLPQLLKWLNILVSMIKKKKKKWLNIYIYIYISYMRVFVSKIKNINSLI